MKIRICHLYPDLLDLYGDKGNIMTLSARCRWRGIASEIEKVSIGQNLDFHNIDILFLGGGSDREQSILVEDLKRRDRALKAAIEDGMVVLSICGGYQLLGQYYQTANGEKIPGLGILDLATHAGSKRLIGNVVVELNKDTMEGKVNKNKESKLSTLVGFENHSGKTFLGQGLNPLGHVIYGAGNNGEDQTEGVRFLNVFGTYLHGPLLPKNPHLADLLLSLALKRRGFDRPLAELNDYLEIKAHNTMLDRLSAK